MTNLYKQETISGEIIKYRRVGSFSGRNAISEVPSITMNEDEVTILPNGEKIIKERVSQITEFLSNKDEILEMLNPVDDSKVGEIKYSDIYVMLYSLYKKIATKRDEATIKNTETFDIQ